MSCVVTLKEKGLKEFDENFYTFQVLKDHFVIAFVITPRILLIDKEKGIQDTEFAIPDPEFPDQFFGKPMSFRNGFLLPVREGDDSKDESINTIKLVYYNLDGSIEEMYRFPGNNTYFLEGILIDNDFICVFNSFTGILYKYKIP